MSRLYMRLDERPDDMPDLRNGLFEDRVKFYMWYLDKRRESNLWKISYVCILIFLISLVLIAGSAILLLKAITVDWSFIQLFDIGKWLNDNSVTVYAVVLISSILMATSSIIAAVVGFKQEQYTVGLSAYIVLIISSACTIIIPIVSIILLIYYIKGKNSFFY